MFLLLLFIGVPLIEIALFIQVGGLIGLWPTLAIVILTALIGTHLVRSQGLATLARVQNSIQTINDPTEPLAHGAMILFAGALLLTPGFFTDAFGFLLLTPKFRSYVFNMLRERMAIRTMNMSGAQHRRSESENNSVILEGDYSEFSEKPVRPSQKDPH